MQMFSFFSDSYNNLLNDTKLSRLAPVALAVMPLGKLVSDTPCYLHRRNHNLGN